MDIDKSLIDSLQIDETALIRRTGEKLGITSPQVAAVVGLLAEDCTVPFIARYRKEKTGSLDEVAVRDIERSLNAGRNLEGRRIEIIRGIYGQGKLTESLYENISKAVTAAELEDIYLPYKRKKKTRGMLALERGLGPLAAAMKELEDGALLSRAAAFVRSAPETEKPEEGQDLSVPTAEDALRGAMDIIAEELSQDTACRAAVKALYQKTGSIVVKGSGREGLGDEEAKKTSTYLMYWDYRESLSRIKAHRILAINRGEREGVLSVTVEVDEEAALRLLRGKYELHNDYHRQAVEDGLKRLLSPAVIREIRGDQSEAADDHGISVFAENLKNLLMQRPIKGSRVLGIDPGIRTGAKCICLDDTGKYLGNFVIFPHHAEEAKRLLLWGIKEYDIQLVAIGNGTGSREAQEIVSQVIEENHLELLYTMVDEDGASVYSAGDIAREEFPNLDVTIRGAISIGRRLQDPLAELVKIDPKSVGVGLYQHDLNQKKLSESLDQVVSSVVNNVGVNLNTASVFLLKRVSGINSALAKTIVRYRDENGRIASRETLVSLSGMGPKSYEQCAGFLKIPESAEPLDNTWVHPENYPLAREIRSILGSATVTGGLSTAAITGLKEKHGVGDVTITDIVEELKRPNRDPRDDCPKPAMQKGLLNFEDLKEGMTVTGKIKNVVDFGAFVDLGIKETALVHISELSDRFVKDPLATVKVGESLEFKIISLDAERRRIGLSRKTQAEAAKPGPRKPAPRPETGGRAPRTKPAAGRQSPAASGRTTDQASGGTAALAAPVAGTAVPAAAGTADAVRPQPGGPYDRQGPKGPGIHGGDRPSGRRGGGFGPGSPRPAAAPRSGGFSPRADDDGTMYNPFAEALRKMGERAAGPKRPKK
ncbi:MAG: helix-hairpin-helix domain-containing protein [Treponema sp.]|jgi:uncharacterized protein|nr:helix-hairpin-helix domain-containing protein [Treponema sp.]